MENKNHSQADKNWLVGFEQYIANNYQDRNLKIPMIADFFTMSDSTLLRTVVRLTGKSPKKYLMAYRMSASKEFLEKKEPEKRELTVVRMGYSNIRSFRRAYKSQFGENPKFTLPK